MIKFTFTITVIFSSFFHLFGQDTTIQYHDPVDIPILLSGNFGEFRNNHFHTGIDIKTQGVQGKKLYAVADGFISRINISPYGYGKALYIDHPDGRTSVYAHMKEFSEGVERFILKKQYEQQSFEMEFYPKDTIIEVLRGEVIGLSGNTGHSGGPHLHFELRETVSEHPVNPLLYNFDIKDQVDPILKGVRIYPIDYKGLVDGDERAKSFPISLVKNDKYSVSKDTITVAGEIGLSVHTIDKMINVNNTFSVYYLKVFIDNELLYAHKMDELDFETNRYLNSHMDYELFHKNRWKYHKCFPAENNQLDIYQKQGETFKVQNNESKVVRIEAGDIEGNNVQCSFVLKGTQHIPLDKESVTDLISFDASKDNYYENEDISMMVPKGSLYDDVNFIYNSTEKIKGYKSKTFQLGSMNTPLQDYIYLTIKLDEKDSANKNLKLYYIDKKGRYKVSTSYVKGKVLQARVKNFGQYVIQEDKTKPVISVQKFPKYPSKSNTRIAFSLSDNLSGVSKIRASVDGQWMLMNYNASLSYTYGTFRDLNLPEGEHEFVLEVRDVCGNVQTYPRTFSWKN